MQYSRVDARHAHARVGAEQQRHLEHDVGLVPEVELGPEAGGELREHLARPETLSERGAPLRHVREQRERREIALDHVVDARPLDLHDDGLAGAQPRPVRLTDRRGGERFPVELGEHLVDRTAELGFERGPDRPRPAPARPGSAATASSSQTSGGMRSTRVAAI